MKKALKDKLRPFYYQITKKSYFANRKKPIVFIFGTGRSGSQAIISTLTQHSQIIGFHEKFRPLIRLSTEYAAAPNNKSILREVKKLWNSEIYPAQNGEVVVHSDQRFWNFIPFFKQYFPHAKYILLVREPVACIKSFLARNIFQDDEYPKFNTHDWAKYRLSGPIAGVMSDAEWTAMSPAERAAWYWGYINSYVKKDFEKHLSKEDYLILETEQMSDRLSEIQQFIKVTPEPIAGKITNRRKPEHKASFEDLEDKKIRLALEKMMAKYPEFESLFPLK